MSGGGDNWMKIRKGEYGWKGPPLDWIKIRKGEYGIQMEEGGIIGWRQGKVNMYERGRELQEDKER